MSRVAMISGANRGLGAAIARELSAQGWSLSLGMRAPAPLDGVSAEAALLHRYDATEGGEAEWVAATLARFGRIDAIVANAGVVSRSSVIEAEDDELDALLAVNVKAPRRLAKAAWPALCASGRGRVIVMSSLAGKRIKSVGAGLYAMSKFAATALAHGVRQAGWEKGVRATAVCPGFVATRMGRAAGGPADEQMTRPGDVARIVAMLLDLPNEASVAEFTVNCVLEPSL
jgi:NADP-dependent 3-hydroxy acid dehydrogenase YdfG